MLDRGSRGDPLYRAWASPDQPAGDRRGQHSRSSAHIPLEIQPQGRESSPALRALRGSEGDHARHDPRNQTGGASHLSRSLTKSRGQSSCSELQNLLALKMTSQCATIILRPMHKKSCLPPTFAMGLALVFVLCRAAVSTAAGAEPAQATAVYAIEP